MGPGEALARASHGSVRRGVVSRARGRWLPPGPPPPRTATRPGGAARRSARRRAAVRRAGGGLRRRLARATSAQLLLDRGEDSLACLVALLVVAHLAELGRRQVAET